MLSLIHLLYALITYQRETTVLTLTNKPLYQPTVLYGDILGEDFEDRTAVIDKKKFWPKGIVPYHLNSEMIGHLGDLPMQNPNLFEGDILGIESPEDRNAIAFEQWRWPGGIIYYKIDASLSEYRVPLKQVMKDYEKKTCLKFVERTTEDDYVKLFNGKGCYCHVGKTGGEQPLSLGNGCHYMGTMAHEIGHAIGFFHEHSRSDRDEYIDIHWDNIKEGNERQFLKFIPELYILYNKFDYESIMLYGERAFSKDRKAKTMTAKKEGVRLKEVYEKYYPTESDYYRINKMYNCIDKLEE